MSPKSKASLLVATVSAASLLATIRTGDGRPAGPDETPKGATQPAGAQGEGPLTPGEARGQARLLHETISTTLQVVHARYYQEDEGLPIPSTSLDEVFDELTRTRGIQFHWLAVDAQAMSVDHKPRDAFEEEAVEALGSGEDAFELVDGDVFRHAGPITLFSQCLKCHLPNRTSTRPRTAGLVITMPLKRE